MLTSAERQPLRNAGRVAYFKAHGKEDWLLQAAEEAKGANARTKELTAWKRNVCNRACFVKLCLLPTPLLHGSEAGSVSLLRGVTQLLPHLGQPQEQ